MNARERFLAGMAFEPVDRPLHWEFGYWVGTLRRWYGQGLPRTDGVSDLLADDAGPFISPALFRTFCLPYYKQLIDFFKSHGIKTILVDSDGLVEPLLPLWIEAGVTGLYPWEIQSGNDLLRVRKAYPRFQILGGIDKKAIARGKDAIDRELESKVPELCRQGGYIPFIDHTVPPEVSWDDFRYYRKRLAELAKA